MAEKIIRPHRGPLSKSYVLPISKSISNRLLVLDKMYNLDQDLSNVSQARDTQILKSLLESDTNIADVQDAGTVMRFLTMYFLSMGRNVEITGSERMKKRPIADLVNSLRDIGFQIEYCGEEGFPPLKLNGGRIQKNKWTVDTSLSSQYASALIMLMPMAEMPVELTLEGKLLSMPYADMTIKMMQLLGANIERKANKVYYTNTDWATSTPELQFQDYSSLAFPMLELAYSYGEIMIEDMQKPQGLQGDESLLDFCPYLGIECMWTDEGLLLQRKKDAEVKKIDLAINFGDIPDLAIPMTLALAAHHDLFRISGIESLNHKESRRWDILQDLLFALGFKVWPVKDAFEVKKVQEAFRFLDMDDHDDHRLSMSMACLNPAFDRVHIKNPDSVAKSYPDFWKYFDRYE